MKVEVAVLERLPVPNSPYGLCGRKATLDTDLLRVTVYDYIIRTQESFSGEKKEPDSRIISTGQANKSATDEAISSFLFLMMGPCHTTLSLSLSVCLSLW